MEDAKRTNCDTQRAEQALQKVCRATESLRKAIEQLNLSSQNRPRAIVSNIVLPNLLGPAPKWAANQTKGSGWSIGFGDLFTVGVTCVYFGRDPETKKLVALVQHRKDGTDEKPKLGLVGGYAEPTERMHKSLIRETSEEVVDDEGRPIFNPKATRFVPLYQDTIPAARNAFCSFAYELDADEMTKLKDYTKRFANEPFKKKVFEASGHEVKGFELIPLEEIIDAKHRKSFSIPMQHDVFISLHNLLEEIKYDTSRLHTIWHRNPELNRDFPDTSLTI